jgi:hypothetical protein
VVGYSVWDVGASLDAPLLPKTLRATRFPAAPVRLAARLGHTPIRRGQ